MIAFIHKALNLRAIAEQEPAVQRLVRKGYTRVDYPTFKAHWQAEDRERAIKLFGPVLHDPYDFESID